MLPVYLHSAVMLTPENKQQGWKALYFLIDTEIKQSLAPPQCLSPVQIILLLQQEPFPFLDTALNSPTFYAPAPELDFLWVSTCSQLKQLLITANILLLLTTS